MRFHRCNCATCRYEGVPDVFIWNRCGWSGNVKETNLMKSCMRTMAGQSTRLIIIFRFRSFALFRVVNVNGFAYANAMTVSCVTLLDDRNWLNATFCQTILQKNATKKTSFRRCVSFAAALLSRRAPHNCIHVVLCAASSAFTPTQFMHFVLLSHRTDLFCPFIFYGHSLDNCTHKTQSHHSHRIHCIVLPFTGVQFCIVVRTASQRVWTEPSRGETNKRIVKNYKVKTDNLMALWALMNGRTLQRSYFSRQICCSLWMGIWQWMGQQCVCVP